MILKMDLNVYNDKTQSGGVEISFIGSMNDKTQSGRDQNVVHPLMNRNSIAKLFRPNLYLKKSGKKIKISRYNK